MNVGLVKRAQRNNNRPAKNRGTLLAFQTALLHFIVNRKPSGTRSMSPSTSKDFSVRKRCL